MIPPEAWPSSTISLPGVSVHRARLRFRSSPCSPHPLTPSPFRRGGTTDELIFAIESSGKENSGSASSPPKATSVVTTLPFPSSAPGRTARGVSSSAAHDATVAELVDAQDLGSCGATRGGSSPSGRTPERELREDVGQNISLILCQRVP